jgi:uncharacterized protein
MGVIRELDADGIEHLLRTSIVGRIACGGHGQGDDARPYLVPIAYGYDGESVFAHSGPGRKLRLMRENPLVTFEVDRAEAPDWWESAIAEGIFEEIPEGPEREAGLRAIYPPPQDIPDLGAFTVVYRIRLLAKSGRYERPT